MIALKTHICDCGKSSKGFKKCQYCRSKIYAGNSKPKERKPIKKRADKRVIQEKEYYSVSRPNYLKAHKVCEIGVEGCTRVATEVHHKKGRIDKLLNDTTYFCAACRNCHQWAEDHPEAAKEIGVSLYRNTKN